MNAGTAPWLRAGLALAAALLSGSAWAHASLVSTEPADGALLESPPSRVVLRFDEVVTPLELRVLDGAGRDLVRTAPAGGGNEFGADLQGLPSGAYWVSWRAVSADSHPVGGAFAFTVGVARAPGAPARAAPRSGETPGWDKALILARFLLYVSLLQAAGAALFRQFVCAPLRIELPGIAALVRRCAILGATAAIISIGLKGAQLLALPVSELLQPSTWAAGSDTTLGASAAVVVAASLLMAATARRPGSCAFAGVAAVAGLCLTGHGAAGALWVQGLTGVHALAAAFWLGALYPLLRVLRADAVSAVPVVQRFSGLALAAVAVLFACGSAIALSRIGAAELFLTAYGRVLALKLLAAGLLLVVAAVNRLRVTPSLAAGTPRAPAVLARNIGLEMAVAAALLLLTATLAHTPPPVHSPLAAHAGSTGGAQPWRARSSEPSGLAAEVSVVPAVAGVNLLEVRLRDRSGQAIVPLSVSAEWRHAELGTSTLERTLAAARPGFFRLERVELPMAGEWDLRIVVLMNEFEQASLDFRVPMRSATQGSGGNSRGEKAPR